MRGFAALMWKRQRLLDQRIAGLPEEDRLIVAEVGPILQRARSPFPWKKFVGWNQLRTMARNDPAKVTRALSIIAQHLDDITNLNAQGAIKSLDLCFA